jgi:hypothetical protein
MCSAFEKAANRFATRRVGRAVADDVEWWAEQLRQGFCGSVLEIPPPRSNQRIYVDASTSWGIGLVIDEKWFAWRLKPGWKADGRDIGWAEMTAVELAIRALVALGHSGQHVRLWSDNAGVVGALKNGCSRNSEQNRCLQRIVTLFTEHRIWPDIEWIATHLNLADKPSRGVIEDEENRLPSMFPIPPQLAAYIEPIVT